MTTNSAAFVHGRAELCGGEPVGKGTRVTVDAVLACFAQGAIVEAIVADFPTRTSAAVRAVNAFAPAPAEDGLTVAGAPLSV